VAVAVTGLGLVLALFVYAGVPWLHARWLRRFLARRAARRGAVVLTFDDGPGSRLTPAVLQVLSEHGAHATFFLLGRNVKGREQIVRETARQGHEVCSHGYEHLHHWRVSPLRAIRDIRRGWQAIDETLGGGKGKYAFRPPYGKLNIFTLAYLWLCRVPIVYWSVDSGDTWARGFQTHTAADSIRRRRGAVVLSHDFDRQDARSDEAVLDTARAVLRLAQEAGLPIVTVRQLLGHEG
jgi:peptidoglycan/xylan/chitin deacetylase (PgdA/CDA1 family)